MIIRHMSIAGQNNGMFSKFTKPGTSLRYLRYLRCGASQMAIFRIEIHENWAAAWYSPFHRFGRACQKKLHQLGHACRKSSKYFEILFPPFLTSETMCSFCNRSNPAKKGGLSGPRCAQDGFIRDATPPGLEDFEAQVLWCSQEPGLPWMFTIMIHRRL